MRQKAGELIVEITRDQLASTRRYLETAIQNGQSSRRTALDLVGRINRATGRREGGVIGLYSRETRAVENAKRMLREGDPAYFNLKSRDKRFDRTVFKAFRDKGGVDAETASKVGGRYADTLLRIRGERIARTEIGHAVHAGADEAMKQVVDTGAVRRNQIRKIWRDTPDSRTRDSHAELGGTSIGMNETFVSPATGARLEFPGDTSHGALGQDTINCRCWLEHRIDFFANE